MKNSIRSAAVITLVWSLAFPALAWGPKARVAIVTTASRILAKEGTIDLRSLERDVMAGASASPETVATIFAVLSDDPAKAIATEMYLLQSVQTDRIDPYFAYRLGVLGAFVAQATGPMRVSRARYREAYEGDVDRHINRTILAPGRRRAIEPTTYFAGLARIIQRRTTAIESDYQDGIGFRGVAQASLKEDASRSVAAVADVWYSVITGDVLVANISEGEIRDYILNALEFYIKRGNRQETDATYARLDALGVQSPEMRERIGDTFFEVGEHERAVAEYKRVLAMTPQRRDIREKVARYYIGLGDGFRTSGDLDKARDAYEEARNVDQLNEVATEKLFQAEGAIAERQSRLEKTRDALKQAEELQTQADDESHRGSYTRAVELLLEAEKLYGGVTAEFDDLAKEARTGLKNVAYRMKELKTDLVRNAQSLSGTGFAVDPRKVAGLDTKQLDREALQGLVNNGYRDLVAQLKQQVERNIRGAQPVP